MEDNKCRIINIKNFAVVCFYEDSHVVVKFACGILRINETEIDYFDIKIKIPGMQICV